MNRRSRLAWPALSLACGLAVLAACSDAAPPEDFVGPGPTERGDAGFSKDGSVYDSTPSPDSGLGELRFQPELSYSGYDGTHTFRVPVAVYDSAGDLKVTASDPAAVSIAETALTDPTKDGITDTGKYFMITVKEPGEVTLTATSGGKTATATLKVIDYDPGRYAAGETRYENGLDADNPPCTTCHVNGQAIDHSPAALATSDDEEVAAVITTGISPAGFPIQGVPGGHRWTVTDTELDGLVTYLRGLPPRGFE